MPSEVTFHSQKLPPFGGPQQSQKLAFHWPSPAVLLVDAMVCCLHGWLVA